MNNSRMTFWPNFLAVLTLFVSFTFLSGYSYAAPGNEDAKQTVLSQNGTALQKIVIAANASERTRKAAETLTHYLSRITTATFTVETGDGLTGIAVGLSSDFPALKLQTLFAPRETLRREEYLLRSQPKGLLLIGATEVAVEHAVWDLLERTGYRQFFPGETWEFVPKTPSLAIAVDTFEKPDFHTRLAWYSHGFWEYNAKPYTDWCARNRAIRGYNLATAHSYEDIISRNSKIFQAHPEYLALVDGKRQGNKFCISNPDLRKLIIDNYVLPHFRENPEADSVSLEPSDGGGWCECDQCHAMGSISTRVVLLANEAAEALSKAYPGKSVGLLAYNLHSPPPAVRVHPNVLVKVQTNFLRGGLTFDQIVEGWQKQGAIIGVGDYYSPTRATMTRPALQKGSDLYAIHTSLPKFYQQGARFFMAESGDAWGSVGLGHYLMAKLSWDTSKAKQFDALMDDFLTKSFGPAKAPMSDFFHLIYRFNKDDKRPLIRQDMLARMYRYLGEANKLAGKDEKIKARLNDLLLFTRYEELMQNTENATKARRQQAVEEVMQHVYRIRKTMMIHAKPIFLRVLPNMAGITPPAKEKVEVDTPFTDQELEQILANGIANTHTVEPGFEPVDFSKDLVPATPLQLPIVPRTEYNAVAPIGRQKFFTWLDAPDTIRLRISGGHIVRYRKISSNVQTRLYANANPIVGEEVAADESVAPDGVEREVVLKSSFEGLHHIEVVPPTNRAKVDIADITRPFTLESSIDNPFAFGGPWSMYFYVPKGTKVVGGFASGKNGSVLDGSGKSVLAFGSIPTPGFFKIDVPAGQDGKLWKFDRCNGQRTLLTVPPYLARSAAELLLPREVVQADRP